MKKTTLTAYQKHVKNFAKTYKGKNLMKAAATAWSKKAGAPKKKPRTSSPSKGGKKVTKKTTTRRGGFKLPGGIGPKAALFGALALTVAPMVLPGQSGGVQKVAVGMGMRALKIGGGGALSAVGLMELIAQFIGPVVSGAGLPIGGNGRITGGTDY